MRRSGSNKERGA